MLAAHGTTAFYDEIWTKIHEDDTLCFGKTQLLTIYHKGLETSNKYPS